MIERTPFTAYKLEEERNKKEEVVSLKLNIEDRQLLNECKKILEQQKDGTAIKQLMEIGAKVIREEKTAFILGTVFKNKRKNARIGVGEFE